MPCRALPCPLYVFALTLLHLLPACLLQLAQDLRLTHQLAVSGTAVRPTTPAQHVLGQLLKNLAVLGVPAAI